MTIDPIKTETNDKDESIELLSVNQPDHQAIDPSLMIGLLSQLAQLIIKSGSTHSNEAGLSISNQVNLTCLPSLSFREVDETQPVFFGFDSGDCHENLLTSSSTSNRMFTSW